jgi:hypothetical protein
MRVVAAGVHACNASEVFGTAATEALPPGSSDRMFEQETMKPGTGPMALLPRLRFEC